MAKQQKLDTEEIARLRQREQMLSTRLAQLQSAVGGGIKARLETAERPAPAPDAMPSNQEKPMITPTPDSGAQDLPPQPENPVE